MREALILKVAFVLMIFISCGKDHSQQVKAIWLLKDIAWQESKTGVVEIDTTRKEAYTEIIGLYDNQLVHGNILLYNHLQTDTIFTAYESGEMQFTGNDCLKVKEMIEGKSIVTSSEVITFKDENTLLYKNKIFEKSTNINYRNKDELDVVLSSFCR